MVPEVGLEPTRDYSHQILSLARLPISPLRLVVTCETINGFIHCPATHNLLLNIKKSTSF
jgi:hypothetical protein